LSSITFNETNLDIENIYSGISAFINKTSGTANYNFPMTGNINVDGILSNITIYPVCGKDFKIKMKKV
jgi:hypothetical protein